MTTHEPPERELSSWKEIAAYLDVGVRTAQVWEQERGLPVRRLPGGRGRVLTTAAELEAWKRSAESASTSPLTPATAAAETTDALPQSAIRPQRLAAAVFGVAAIGLGLGWWFFYPREPAGFRIEQNSLVILDGRGRECWRKSFPFPVPQDQRRLIWIGDLDGDGDKEVLFSPATPAETETELICYTYAGHEKWRFVPGRTVRTPGETFAPPYRTQLLAVTRLGTTGALGVVIISEHYLYFPTQVALLSPDGRLLREYWHSGGLGTLVVDEGRILVGGVNNGTKSGTVIALDPHTMAGASVEENPAYQLQGFAPGVEVARLIFPRSCINRLLEPMAVVTQLWKQPEEFVAKVEHRPATNDAPIYYHLNPDLTPKSVVLGSGFERAHQQLRATHVLDHALSPGETESLSTIRYTAATAPAGPSH